MPLTTALLMLLEAGISALPVVDAEGVLLDVYARGDITLLARSNAYSRLQFEDMTVAQALSLAGLPGSSGSGSAGNSGSGVFAFLNLGDLSMQHSNCRGHARVPVWAIIFAGAYLGDLLSSIEKVAMLVSCCLDYLKFLEVSYAK
jgi:CBS domain-containing protein